MARIDRSVGSELREFLRAEPREVPDALSEQIVTRVSRDLRPSSLAVFVKLSGIQFVAGLVSLFFCPQFGISFTQNMGLMPYLMRFGESVCLLGCGALFVSLSLLIASALLRPEEVRVLAKHQVLQIGAVSLLSLGAFLCAGGEVVLSLGAVWVSGALIGGAASLELGWLLRRRFVAGGAG